MSWIKDREEFKEATLSTARAVSKNPNLESSSQAPARPPSLSQSQISLNYPPRSSTKVNSWRGEADFQAFWFAFHQEHKTPKMPKIARDFFIELELSRVEIVGGEAFPGSRMNINAYLNAQAKKGIDMKVSAINPLAANLWLKKLNGDELAEDSKNTVDTFLSSIPKNIKNLGKELIKARHSQEEFQSLAITLMNDLGLMHEPQTHGSEESLDKEPKLEDQEDINENQGEPEQSSETQIIQSKAESLSHEETEILEEAQAPIDSTSIDEEIDLTRNFNADINHTAYENYKIFSTQ